MEDATDDDFVDCNISINEVWDGDNNQCKKRDLVLLVTTLTGPTEVLKRFKSEGQSSNNGYFRDDMEDDKDQIHGLVLSSF